MPLNRKKISQILMLFFIVVIAALSFENVKYAHSQVKANPEAPLAEKFQIHYIDDSENPLSLEQVHKLPIGMYAENKEIHTPDSLIFSVWYRIILTPDEKPFSDDFSVTVDNPTLNNITFYLVSGSELLQKKAIGDNVYSSNKLDYIVPKIDVVGGMQHNKTLFINIKTNGASASPIIIEELGKAQFRASMQLILLGAFIGVILIMIIYNFIMFKGIGDPSFFNYIGYIGFAGLAIGLINGTALYFLPFALAYWINEHLMIAHFIGLVFALRFAISFLRLDKVKPWFVSVGINGSRVILLCAGSALFISEATLTPVYFSFVLFVYVYVISLMLMVINSRFMWVRYYLFSWVPLFVGVGIGIAAFNGGVPYNFVTRNAALLGVLAEVSIMAIALMDRFKANTADKEYRSNHDEVTGLPNKKALEDVIEKLSQSKKTFNLMLFEVPQAKSIIPSLGTKVADKFLIDLFQNIESYASGLSSVYEFERNVEQKSFHAARVGNAYFALIFVGEQSQNALSENFLIIQEAVSTLIKVNNTAMSVSCNAGVISYPTDTTDKKNLVTLAFQALLGCKANEYSMASYKPNQSEIIRKRFELAAELQIAIDNDDLELFHQPQVNLKSGEVFGSELLLRWSHGEQGLLDTKAIIQVAEETGTINNLTEWVITKGLLQHSKLYRLGFEHTISINLSAHDLTDNNLIAHILTTVSENIIPPQTVIFEITESAITDNKELAKDVITELHQEGFKIAVDDFGTGHSSLTLLTQLPLNIIKIDRSFVSIKSSKQSKMVAEMSISMGRQLGVSVIAQGIETEDTSSAYQDLHCILGQGYLYARPMAFIDYMRWLQKKP